MFKKLLFLVQVACIALPAFGQENLKTENVFLITLDGLRWQEVFTGVDSLLIDHSDYVSDPEQLRQMYWEEGPELRREKLMPFFWNVIAEEGQLYGNRKYRNYVDVTNGLFFSYPGYSELLVGYVDESINSNQKVWNPNETVLEFINNQTNYRGKVAVFGSWDVFPYIINRKRSGIYVNAGFEMVKGTDLTGREKFLNELLNQIPSPWNTVRLDAFTHHYAIEFVKKNQPRVLYVAFGETDDFAHDGNYQAYIHSVNQTDAFIKELWEYVQSDPVYKDKTTFIISTDHGRGTKPINHWRDHGSDINGAEEIWIAVLGPDTQAYGEMKKTMQLFQTQIAKTIAYMLGFNYENKKPVGEVIYTIFE